MMEEYPWPGNLQELEALVAADARGREPPTRSAPTTSCRAASPSRRCLRPRVGVLLDETTPSARAPRPVAHDERRRGRSSALGRRSSRKRRRRGAGARRGARRRAPRGDGALGRLVGALSHEVRNPLATIRTFAELLPRRFQDPEFRERFAGDGARRRRAHRRAGRAPGRGGRAAAARAARRWTSRRCSRSCSRSGATRSAQRSLLVLKELETSAPQALGDREQLRLAFDALLGKCLEWVPERGDVYIASRHHATGPGAAVRRCACCCASTRRARRSGAPGVSLAETSLDLMIAEIIVRAQGGDFAVARDGRRGDADRGGPARAGLGTLRSSCASLRAARDGGWRERVFAAACGDPLAGARYAEAIRELRSVAPRCALRLPTMRMGGRVLVVDDERGVRESLRMLLGEECTVAEAASVDEALARRREPRRRISCCSTW